MAQSTAIRYRAREDLSSAEVNDFLVSNQTLILSRTLADSLVVIDSIIGEVVSEQPNAQSTVIRFRNRQPTADSFDLADSFEIPEGAINNKLIQDFIDVQESISAERKRSRTASDDFPTIDSMVASRVRSILSSENFVLSDFVEVLRVLNRAISDDFAAEDSITVGGSHLYAKVLADALDASDAFVEIRTRVRTPADVSDVADAIEALRLRSRTPADAATLSDSLTRHKDHRRLLTSNFAALDFKSVTINDSPFLSVVLSDSFDLTDSIVVQSISGDYQVLIVHDMVISDIISGIEKRHILAAVEEVTS